MRKLGITLASLLVGFAGCRGDMPEEIKFPEKQDYIMADGTVVEGYVEIVDKDGEDLNYVTVKHGTIVCDSERNFLYWWGLNGEIDYNDKSRYLGQEYPAWDVTGFRKFIGREDNELPRWAKVVKKLEKNN